MMKRLNLLLLAAVCIGVFAAPRAQALGIMGMWWNSDGLQNGFGIGAKHRIKVLILSVDGRVGYMRFDDPGVNAIPLEATAQIDISLLYVGAGVGYYILDNGWKSKPGVSILGGASLGLGGVGVFGELMYTWVDGEHDTFGSVKPLDGPRINLGVKF